MPAGAAELTAPAGNGTGLGWSMTMMNSDLAGTMNIPGAVRRRIAAAFAARRRGAPQRAGAIGDHLLRDIGITPFGIREATLAERNEARR